MTLLQSFLTLHTRTVFIPLPSDVKWGVKWLNTIFMAGICYPLVFGVLAGCAAVSHQTESASSKHTQQGVASWYGPSFHGNPTANGERYNMWALTAAHRTLPFDTRVQVQSVETGKSVIVRINDRGPFIRGRVIDLSYGAARELAMIGKGIENVILTILDSPSAQFSRNVALGRIENYWVQAGSFATLTQAVSMREQLANHYPQVRLKTVELPSGSRHRVQIGAFPSQEKAKLVATELESQFNLNPLVIQDN